MNKSTKIILIIIYFLIMSLYPSKKILKLEPDTQSILRKVAMDESSKVVK